MVRVNFDRIISAIIPFRLQLFRVEPLLYRTVVVGDVKSLFIYPPAIDRDTFLSIIQSKSAPFLRAAVHNLLMYDLPRKDQDIILSVCSRVQNLWITGGELPLTNLSPRISNLPLRRLHSFVEVIFEGEVDFKHHMFSQITHLELFDDALLKSDREVLSGLAHIPHLTHLSLNNRDRAGTPILSVLRTCKSLRVFAVLMGNGHRIIHPQIQEIAEDPRFVVMTCSQYVRDWQRGTYTGKDYWARAEDFISKRRSREIDRALSTKYFAFGLFFEIYSSSVCHPRR